MSGRRDATRPSTRVGDHRVADPYHMQAPTPRRLCDAWAWIGGAGVGERAARCRVTRRRLAGVERVGARAPRHRVAVRRGGRASRRGRRLSGRRGVACAKRLLEAELERIGAGCCANMSTSVSLSSVAAARRNRGTPRDRIVRVDRPRELRTRRPGTAAGVDRHAIGDRGPDTNTRGVEVAVKS